jgi:hypothetical protein
MDQVLQFDPPLRLQTAEASPPLGSAPGNGGDRAQTVRRLLILIALYALPAVIIMQRATDPDVFWHLRTGQWIVEHETVPTTDPFSSYGQDKTWVAYSWLFEIAVYGLYAWLGLFGIILYRVILVLAIVAALHHLVARREPGFVRATTLVALGFFTLVGLLSERSWLFSILFYLLSLDTVLDLRAGRQGRAIWLLPLAYAIWANVHIQFANGLFLLGLACAAPLCDRVLGMGGSPGDSASTAGSRGWWTLVALTAACLVATLVNPYGIGLYQVVVEMPTQSGAFNLVSEVQAMPFRGPEDWLVLGLAGLAAFTLGRRRKLSTFEILLLASSAFFSFRAQRDLWLVVFAALAIFVTDTGQPRVTADTFAWTRWRILVVAGATVLVLVVTAWRRDLTEVHLQEEVAANYPARAAAVIEQRGYPGPLYNHYNWGGYLMWRLPHLPVSIDGRANLYGDEQLERSALTWKGHRGWNRDPDLRAARLVIADPKSALASLLRLDARFQVAHEDAVAVVFVARRNLQS